MSNIGYSTSLQDELDLLKENNPTKQELILINRSFAPNSLEILINQLRQNPHITTLLIRNCNFGEDGLKKLLDAFQDRSLKRLRIEAIPLSETELTATCSAIQQHPELEEINLSNDHISDTAGVKIAESAAHLPHLRLLKLDRNQIAAQTAIALAASIKTCPDLRTLNIESCSHLGPLDMEVIINAIADCPNLRKFMCSYVALKDSQVAILENIISSDHPLNQLKAEFCNITPKAGANLLLASMNKPEMVSCALAGNGVFEPEDNAKIEAHAATSSNWNFSRAQYSLQADRPNLRKLLDRNERKARQLRLKLMNTSEKPLTVALLCELYARLPLLSRYNDDATKESYEHLLDDMPPFNDITHPRDLIRPNECGLTPLDNPAIWAQIPHIMEKLKANGTPLTYDIFMHPNRDGDPSICNAIHANAFVRVLECVNSHGIQFTLDAMLDADNQPSALLECAKEKGGFRELFTMANWAGQDPNSLTKVFRHLPDDMTDSIPHYYGLKAHLNMAFEKHHTVARGV